MAENNKEPVAENMVSAEDATVIPWAETRERLAEGSTHWLATVRPDGRPHVVPVGAIWLDGAFYFTTGQGTRKGSNVVGNPHCVIFVPEITDDGKPHTARNWRRGWRWRGC